VVAVSFSGASFAGIFPNSFHPGMLELLPVWLVVLALREKSMLLYTKTVRLLNATVKVHQSMVGNTI